jgi:hypothetical protein
LCPFLEEPNGVNRSGVVARDGHGRESNDALAVHAQWLATRREEPNAGTASQQLRHQVRRRLKEVLAVVENDECVALTQGIYEGVGGTSCGTGTEKRRERRRELRRFTERSKFDEPDSPVDVTDDIGCDLQGRAGFPRAAGTADRDEAMLGHQQREFR